MLIFCLFVVFALFTAAAPTNGKGKGQLIHSQRQASPESSEPLDLNLRLSLGPPRDSHHDSNLRGRLPEVTEHTDTQPRSPFLDSAYPRFDLYGYQGDVARQMDAHFFSHSGLASQPQVPQQIDPHLNPYPHFDPKLHFAPSPHFDPPPYASSYSHPASYGNTGIQQSRQSDTHAAKSARQYYQSLQAQEGSAAMMRAEEDIGRHVSGHWSSGSLPDNRAWASGSTVFQALVQHETGETGQGNNRARRKGKRILQGPRSALPQMHGQSAASESVLRRLPANAPILVTSHAVPPGYTEVSRLDDESIFRLLREYRFHYLKFRDRSRRFSCGLPDRREQDQLLKLRNKFTKQNESFLMPETEEELQTQFQQAKELLEYARSVLSQNQGLLKRAQKNLISKVLEKRDAALNTRRERKCDAAARQATQRRDNALMPSKNEEQWLKSTFRDVEIGAMYDSAEDEVEKNWEKMSSLLRIAMDAYKFNQPAISSDTREILRVMFRNIVARKLHQIKTSNRAGE